MILCKHERGKWFVMCRPHRWKVILQMLQPGYGEYLVKINDIIFTEVTHELEIEYNKEILWETLKK